MTTTSVSERLRFNAESFGKATDNGLWAALASKVNTSAAGSRLAGPTGLGQPISASSGEPEDDGRLAPVIPLFAPRPSGPSAA